MSTRFEILDAKSDYESHNCGRVCPYPCPTKKQLFQVWMRVAGRWGMDEYPETHDERQRRQYHERVPGGARG